MNSGLSMQIVPKQEQRQEQKLVMTPKMQQAIKLLLMSRMELTQHIEQEMKENPVLEQTTETVEDTDIEEPDDTEEEPIEELDISWDDLYEDSSSSRVPKEPEYVDEDEQLYYYNFADENGILEHLMMQLSIAPFSDEEHRIGEEVIGNIDDNGFLTASPEEIAEKLDTEFAKVNRVWDYIKHEFEPTGIGAENSQECLLIQLESMHLDETLAEKIIEKHYNNLINNKLPVIAKDLGVDIADIQKELEIIKTLNPIPGNRFNTGEPNSRVIPDVEVKKVDDDYQIITKNNGVPRLMLSKKYIRMMQNPDSLDSKTKEWLEERKRRAIELLKMIEQRQDTIKNITKAIFDIQKDFLDKGIEGLKPLTLKDIADMANVHESTVSRVTTNKYVQTPQGIYELKFFFTGGLERDSGSDISTRRVKQMIRKMIDEEDSANPLSDSEISKRLKEKGIHIKRRTVTKYRNEMNILSSTKRRREWK